MKSYLIPHSFEEKHEPEINPLTGDSFEYKVKWYDSDLSEDELMEKREKARQRCLRQQEKKVFNKPKFKFTPSLPSQDNPQIQKLNESMALMETDPRRRYTMVCRLLTYYENLCTEYNQAGYGLTQRTNVRTKRDFWQSEIDRLLIEII